ncbi:MULTISPECIES: lipid IV(A) 3-deoxy-D-manno-octulosonic acid transferase [unclassified Pseudoxanthomonas]|uniref:lipid IV(A) 3-deoxy-D-manno-octulosonic acid transferase n=1 Tax=unclassified Pseudoxanthomonas TaxID=2645906 RepID=UPI0008F2AE68|nr:MULTISPECIES: lipid IV(A) 3-deoxy-D-manno-octulosonic acid transferase [unclassified Pseudoxanthomonas]PPJ41396.1 3-deoxy-D-manno-octulosonic acid transferase [Pseudoxanthomonas sp. KAs_5_3]SFV30423.1 3-deoxy-D-manno-octulosonic-acid transferase [Pseudoxanthomonas sp. YR558]
MPNRTAERLLRALYSVVLYVLTPVTVYHLIWRGFRYPEYFQRWNERYGSYAASPRPVDVWLHAVSVGEVNAAAPVVDALLKRHRGLRLLVTTITPTGSERVRALWGDRVLHVYSPYDLPGAVARFLDHFPPRLALIMETELWPSLLFGCHDRKVPVYILNARLSARSLRGYSVLRPLIARTLRTVRRVAAQSEGDAARFVQLGAAPEQVRDVGNLKFDIPVPANVQEVVAGFRGHLPQGRPVWIAASTHEDEESPVREIHARLRQRWPNLLLLWAPRHPERFPRVAEGAREAGWKVGTRRADQWPASDDDVFVLDTLGELMAFYACADVAFVGGSLQAIGGHNLLEPAAVGTPAVTGPHLHNFSEISRRLKEADALVIAPDAVGVARALEDLLGDQVRREAVAAHGRALVEHGRGALARTLVMIAPHLPAPVA